MFTFRQRSAKINFTGCEIYTLRQRILHKCCFNLLFYFAVLIVRIKMSCQYYYIGVALVLVLLNSQPISAAAEDAESKLLREYDRR